MDNLHICSILEKDLPKNVSVPPKKRVRKTDDNDQRAQVCFLQTHDLNRSTQLKLAAIGLVGGFAIVVLAVNLTPEFLKLILGTA